MAQGVSGVMTRQSVRNVRVFPAVNTEARRTG